VSGEPRASVRGSIPGIALFLLSMVAVPAAVADAGTAYLSIEAVPSVPGTQDFLAQQWTIYLDGQFDRGATERLAALLAQQGIAHASVYLNSPGGSLIEGMAIGRVLREHRFATHVGKRTADPRKPASGVCYSACPFAYAGGVGRFLEDGSVMGIHRATNRVAVPDEFAFEQVVSGQEIAYLTAMGIDSQLVRLVASTPPDGIRLLNREEALKLRIVNDGGVGSGAHP
jgi:hypothetical protein